MHFTSKGKRGRGRGKENDMEKKERIKEMKRQVNLFSFGGFCKVVSNSFELLGA